MSIARLNPFEIRAGQKPNERRDCNNWRPVLIPLKSGQARNAATLRLLYAMIGLNPFEIRAGQKRAAASDAASDAAS